MNKNIEINNRRAAFIEFENNDFVEVTEWTNQEGYDITVNGAIGNRILPVTFSEFKAIKKLIKYLDKNER